ncbi:GNAT family N-acetyltransferase [Streptomyces sp. NPDC090088]|uniref:GNAT family N-acetyltransferase n=1 Tax=Streptomyces sp. NPDC090088 TaxID=3365944 RepID=UPI0037F77461
MNAVTTWTLEQTSAADLISVRVPEAATSGDLSIVRVEIPSPELNCLLYAVVGAGFDWSERREWTPGQWLAFVSKPGVETWLVYERGTPAGYIELDPQPDGAVEITQFGLLPAFQGRGIGGYLLSYGTARAWDLAKRWEHREPTKRVWLHTCSKDSPHALGNYERRGFRVFDTKTEQAE